MRKKRTGLQKEIAEKTGLHPSTVSLIFNGKRQPSPAQAAMLEEILIKRGFTITRWDLLYRYPKDRPLLSLAEGNNNV